MLNSSEIVLERITGVTNRYRKPRVRNHNVDNHLCNTIPNAKLQGLINTVTELTCLQLGLWLAPRLLYKTEGHTSFQPLYKSINKHRITPR